jgi:SAM-dependent methyltransferase
VEFALADAELEETLENLDGAENYAKWIFGLVAPYVGGEVLEVGAGHGTFTERLAQPADRLVACELSERCTSVLIDRFAGNSAIEVVHGDVTSAAASGPFDTVVLINVLEHIERDDETLREIRGLLNPGGRLVLWVPAFPMLYSDFDRRIGHYRRYRRSALQAQLLQAGFDVSDIRYVNAVGALAWLVVARYLGRTPTTGAPVRLFDRYLVPVLRALERRIRVPFGQSVFAVAARPLHQTPLPTPAEIA